LAVLWAKKGCEVVLWGNVPERVEQLRSTRINTSYLPGVQLPDSIGLTSDLRDCADAGVVVLVTPSTALRKIATQFRPVMSRDQTVLLSCTKGIEHGNGMRMSEVLLEIFPTNPVAVLSGPNLAAEVALDLPTASVLACTEPTISPHLQTYLGTPRFRIYTGAELAGIELGG